MGVRAPEESAHVYQPPIGPPVTAIIGVGVLAFALLLANGRAVPAGSSAGSDDIGKALAALASAGAVAALFAAMGRAHPSATARRSALLFGLGTTVWASSQSLGPQPFALLALSVAVLMLLKAGDDPVWAGRAGVPLALAVAAWPASVAAALVLGVGAVWRWPKGTLRLLAWAAPGIALRFAIQPPLPARFGTGLEALGEGLGTGHLGLVVSPAKGLLVFTPVVIIAAIGMARAWGWGERWLVLTLGGAFVAQWALVGASRDWHGSPGWGPVTLTSALPLLCLFLPEGLESWPRLGACLGALSIAVQTIGAFASDGRWERLYGSSGKEAFWSIERSPIPYYVRRRVVILALPGLLDGRWRTREYRFVVGGATGSRFTFGGDDVVVSGADATAGDIHLLGGARVSAGRAALEVPGDGLFLRVRPVARLRALELRVVGQGSGTLAVGEGSFWSPPRVKEYAVAGTFRLRHRYLYAESGGADLTVEVERGRASLASVALVAPGDPDNPLELPAR